MIFSRQSAKSYRSRFLLCLVPIVLVGFANAAFVSAQDKLVTGNRQPLAATLRQDLKFLSSDDLKGRSVTDDTIDVAADYIAKRMASMGLKTDSYDGTPFQPVEVNVGSEIGSGEKNQLTIRATDGKDQENETKLSLGNGYSPLTIGANEAAVSAPLVFAGYGITAPKLGYDDYEGLDAKGAAVIVIRKEPQLSDPDSPFDGTGNSRHAFFVTKVSNAVRHGALAVLIVNDPASINRAVREQEQRKARERQRLKDTKKQIEELPEEAKKNRAALEERLVSIERMIKAADGNIANAKRGVLEISEAGGRNKQTRSIPVVSIARDVVDELLKKQIRKIISRSRR